MKFSFRVAAVFNPENDSDNSMISVYPFCDEYYTFTESAVIHRIDPKTLETTGKVLTFVIIFVTLLIISIIVSCL